MKNINDFSMDFFSLKGKNAIVTGGVSGLGQAFALALAKAGANIFVFAAVDDDGTTQKLIEACGVKYAFMLGDITEDGICDKVADKCVETFGSIDILVNCAGICKIADVLDFGRAEWDPMIAINLTGAFDLSHAVAKYMIPQRSGRIINICSLFSFLGGLGSPAYAAMKAGLFKEHIPADRWGERQDLMGAMVFLASKAADYVNGTLLVVDGGYLVR